jgi:hypothetical protein
LRVGRIVNRESAEVACSKAEQAGAQLRAALWVALLGVAHMPLLFVYAADQDTIAHAVREIAVLSAVELAGC